MNDPRTAAFDAVMEAVESYRQCERWNSTGIPAEYKAAVRRAVRAYAAEWLEWADDQLPPIVDGRGVIRRRITELQEEA